MLELNLSSGVTRAAKLPVYRGPGPYLPVAGNYISGFFGVIDSSEFISIDNLVDQLGLTNTLTNVLSKVDWFKFYFEDRIIFVPKTSIGNGVSWNDLEKLDLIDGSREVYFEENFFRVRLMKGSNRDPFDGELNTNSIRTSNSEYDRTLYNVSSRHYPHSTNKKWLNLPTSELGGTNQDLMLESYSGNLSNSIRRRISDGFVLSDSKSTKAYYRPVLELITDTLREPLIVSYLYQVVEEDLTDRFILSPINVEYLYELVESDEPNLVNIIAPAEVEYLYEFLEDDFDK